jgi:hypothetical protein
MICFVKPVLTGEEFSIICYMTERVQLGGKKSGHDPQRSWLEGELMGVILPAVN